MKITKFPQSCLWIETKGKKILVDPGNSKYPVDFAFVKKMWDELNLEYEILENGETIEIE